MKKLIGIMVSLFLVVLLFSQSAFALTPAKFSITVGTAQGDVGSMVTVPIRFICAEQFPVSNVDFKLAYDTSVLQLVSINPGEIVPNPSVNFDSAIYADKASFLFVDESNDNYPIKKTGIFANLNFTIKKAGTSKISLASLGAIDDNNLAPISYTFSEGAVEGKEICTSSAGITPSEIWSNPSSVNDVSITTSGSTLSDIKNGTASLIKDTDYTTSGTSVTIKKSYLNYYFNKFPDQNLYLNICFSNGIAKILTIYTGSSPYPAIYPTSRSYPLNYDSDIMEKTELNGNFISYIKNGENTLVPRIDYTYSPNDKNIIIKRDYLNYYFSKNAIPAKFSIAFTGGSVLSLPVNPVSPDSNPTGITLAIDSPSVAYCNTLVVPISIHGVSTTINNLDLKLAYNQQAVDSVSVTAGQIIPDESINFTSRVADGSINILFADETQGYRQIDNDGTFAVIRFNLKSGYSDPGLQFFQPGGCSDVNMKEIPITYVNNFPHAIN